MAKAAACEFGSLHYAAAQKGAQWLEVLKTLLEAGIPVDQPDASGSGQTALHSACRSGCIQTVVFLLRRKADPNSRDTLGCTPLLYTVYTTSCSAADQLDIMRRLLDSGADIAAATGRGITALAAAAWKGNRELVRLLLDRGASVDSGGPLVLAATQGHAAVARLLLERGASLSGVDMQQLLKLVLEDAKVGCDRMLGLLVLPCTPGCCSSTQRVMNV